MSQDDVAAVEDAYEALASAGLDQFVEHWSDDLDHRSIKGAPDDRGPIHGKDALRAYVQDWMDTFDEFWIEPVELIDAGGGVVVAVLRYGGRAKLSGIETDGTFAVVFTIRDRNRAWPGVRDPRRGPRSRRAVGVAVEVHSNVLTASGSVDGPPHAARSVGSTADLRQRAHLRSCLNISRPARLGLADCGVDSPAGRGASR